MIITIDGTIATGKSSVAKRLAESIGFIFFDTGAMYRSLTYGLLKHHINLENTDDIKNFLETYELEIKVIKRERRYFFENEDISNVIRGEHVTSSVSKVSAIKEVRDKLVELQQKLAIGVNAVFEGRDMGTVVFPDAYLKIFLTGDPKVRAQRRFDELKKKYPEESKDLTIERCLEEINQRDSYDLARANSPLKQADDAYVIDTSNLSIEDVVYKILEYKDTRRVGNNVKKS